MQQPRYLLIKRVNPSQADCMSLISLLYGCSQSLRDSSLKEDTNSLRTQYNEEHFQPGTVRSCYATRLSAQLIVFCVLQTIGSLLINSQAATVSSFRGCESLTVCLSVLLLLCIRAGRLRIHPLRRYDLSCLDSTVSAATTTTTTKDITLLQRHKCCLRQVPRLARSARQSLNLGPV